MSLRCQIVVVCIVYIMITEYVCRLEGARGFDDDVLNDRGCQLSVLDVLHMTV